MAKMTNVPNSKLCQGIVKTMIETYVGFVDDFATKYANRTTITIPNNAEKWEGHVAINTNRLDLQGAENGYGNLQAQWGRGHDTKCKIGGSYGGVLLVCNTPFSIADVQTALRRSLQSGGTFLVRLDIDDAPIDIVPPKHKAQKTKTGKEPWTPNTKHF